MHIKNVRVCEGLISSNKILIRKNPTQINWKVWRSQMKSGGIVPSGGKLLDTKRSIKLRKPFWYNNPIIASKPIKKTKTNL